MSERPMIANSGTFDCWTQGFDFPSLLLAICESGRTGELSFRSSEAEKTIVLKDGEIVFARSSSADDRLGAYLLREHKIRFEHLTELSRFVTPAKRYGAVLVENGVLRPEELVNGVKDQVRAIIMSLFTWTQATFKFEPKEPGKETILLRIPLPRLIIQGVRQVRSWRRLTAGIGDLDAAYQTNDGIEDAVHDAKLDSLEEDLIAEMRGPKTISEICASTELKDFEVCQLLWAFRALEWVAPAAEAGRAALPGLSTSDTFDSVIARSPIAGLGRRQV